MEDVKQISVHLEGRTSVDINTVINVLTHQLVVITEAHKALGEIGSKVDVRVSAIRQGSVVFGIDVVNTSDPGALFASATAVAASVVTVVGGITALFRHFKGKRIKKEQEEEAKRIIVAGDNNIVLVSPTIHTYNSEVTREALVKTIQTIKSDPAVIGFSLNDEETGEVIAHISEEEFADLTELPKDDIPGDKTITEDAVLVITSLSFEKGNFWVFVYRGDKVRITVKDKVLQGLIDGGMKFGKGDALSVRLETTQKYDTTVKTYVNKSRRIAEVYEVIPAHKVPALSFPQE